MEKWIEELLLESSKQDLFIKDQFKELIDLVKHLLKATRRERLYA
jgi:hypothetical protein